MRTGRELRWCGAVLILAATLGVRGQAPAGAESGSRLWIASAQRSPVLAPAPGAVVREIDDPHTGTRWLLMRDMSHPGGPGRLVQAEDAGNRAAQNKPEIEPYHAKFRPVLRARDRLIVEENTPRVEARFEAVALGPAALGSVVAVRLTMGGRVVRVVALGSGRARLQTGPEARP